MHQSNAKLSHEYYWEKPAANENMRRGNHLFESDTLGTTTTEYIWLGNQRLATVQGGSLYYVHTDHLGTVQLLTDGAGAVVWSGDYKPFGGVDNITGSVTNNLRFPGQYADEETGLNYNYYRDYDPTTGRYVQSDPVGLAAGYNTYAYTSVNPIRYFDIYGLAKCCEDKVVGYSATCLRRLTSALTQCLNLVVSGGLGDGMVGMFCSAVPIKAPSGGLCNTMQQSTAGFMEVRCEKAFNVQAEKQCAITECV